MPAVEPAGGMRAMGSRPAGRVEQWRGFDPGWGNCDGHTRINLLARAPGQAVAAALREHPEVPGRMNDLLADGGDRIGRVGDDGLFVYQLRGSAWAQVDPLEGVLTGGFVEPLSRRLSTQAFRYTFEAIASAVVYELYDGGELVELYASLYDNPVYRGEEGEADLRRKRAEGYRVSADHTFEFYTRRGTALDIESPAECHALPRRVVKELRMFIACYPWWYDPKEGRVALTPGWRAEDFAAAYVFYGPPPPPVRPPVPDTPLRLG